MNSRVKRNSSTIGHNDIFYQDSSSLNLFPTAPRKFTFNYPRSLTPQCFIHRSDDGRGKTEKMKPSSKGRSEAGSEKHKVIDLGNSRHPLYSDISNSIKDIILGKIERSLNPEKPKKQKAKTLTDL